MGEEKTGDVKPGFTVRDRRSFADSQDAQPLQGREEDSKEYRGDDAGRDPRQALHVEAASQPARPARDDEAVEGRPGLTESEPAWSETAPLEPLDFHTFILSLGSSALLHLGELDHPDGAPSTPDLPMAKHTIDIIAMLEQKTKGNLTAPETRLIESLLFDLRLRYVERSKAGP